MGEDQWLTHRSFPHGQGLMVVRIGAGGWPPGTDPRFIGPRPGRAGGTRRTMSKLSLRPSFYSARRPVSWRRGFGS